MKKIFDIIIANALVIVLFIALAIEAKELFNLGDQTGKSIDTAYLIVAVPLTLALFITTLYGLIKSHTILFLRSALVTFVCTTILSWAQYIHGSGGQFIAVPILSMALLAITVINLKKDASTISKEHR